MKLTAKVIEAALFEASSMSFDASDVPRRMADLLVTWQRIADGVRKFHDDADRLNAAHAKQVSENEKALAVLRRTCPHPVKTYQADPCGRDSSYTCDVCGGIL